MRTSLTTKIIIATALCLMVRALIAQAPAGGLATETDSGGHKYLVPNLKYLDPKLRATLQALKTEIRGMVTSPTAPLNDAAQKAKLDAFYLQYFFPVMTIEDGLKNAADQRKLFLSEVAAAKDQAMHSYLINLAFNTMKQVVQDNGFYPAARYNAMLLISQLNDTEANTTTAPPTLPDPMRNALPFIFQQFQSSDSDEIRIAALLGLSRHLEMDSYKPAGSAISTAQRATIFKELMALAETKDSPPTRDPEVHTWMRRRAIEALMMACSTKADAEVAAAMERMLKDESNPVNVRLAAATALGRMSLQAPVKIDAVAMAKELGYLAMATCEAELTRVEAQRKADYEHYARLAGTYSGEEYSSGPGMPGAGRMPGMPGGMGPGGDSGITRAPLRPSPGSSSETGYGNEAGYVNPAEMDPKHYQVEFLRRRIRQELFAVQLGLTGGEDFVEPKTKTTGAIGGANSAASSGGTGATAPGEKKGVHAIAKGDDQEKIKQVYYKVRKLAEVAEQGGESEFYQFVKDMRKELRNLELVVGKRLPPAGAAGPAATLDDAPAAAPAGKGPPKTAPKGAPATPKTGKAAYRSPPQVFGQPRPRR